MTLLPAFRGLDRRPQASPNHRSFTLPEPPHRPAAAGRTDLETFGRSVPRSGSERARRQGIAPA